MPTTTAPLHLLAAGEGERLDVLGDRQTVKISGDETGGAFALIENVNPPGAGIPPHVHRREDEAFYVLEGRVEFTVEGEPHEVEAGGVVFLPRGTAHGFRVVGDRPARMLILLAPAGLERYFRRLAALDTMPEPAALAAMSEPYGIEFLPPQDYPPTP